MKERPILMSGAMVRAILQDKKQQTRRVVKPEPEVFAYQEPVKPEPRDGGRWIFMAHSDKSTAFATSDRQCPYGQPGDRLNVRESGWERIGASGTFEAYYYDASVTDEERAYLQEHAHRFRRRPSIHMPRWACRLVLEVTAVRVERLLAISVDDCFAEGIEAMRCPQCHLACYGLPGWGHEDVQKTPPEAYWHLWDQINEARGYGRAKNPWCWVVEFQRCPATT